MRWFWFALQLAATAAQSGEEACQNKGFGPTECTAVGCCQYDDAQCWSAVHTAPCSSGGGGGRVLLSGVVGWADGAVVWHDPPSGWGVCGKVTTVFGVAVCVTPAAWSESEERCNHVAHVFYQLMDNDADGNADDPEIQDEMVGNGYFLFVPATESDMENMENMHGPPDGVGASQMTGIWEAIPNSCDTPTNRGASASDRSTWAAAVDTSALSCDDRRDATTEEVLP